MGKHPPSQKGPLSVVSQGGPPLGGTGKRPYIESGFSLCIMPAYTRSSGPASSGKIPYPYVGSVKNPGILHQVPEDRTPVIRGVRGKPRFPITTGLGSAQIVMPTPGAALTLPLKTRRRKSGPVIMGLLVSFLGPTRSRLPSYGHEFHGGSLVPRGPEVGSGQGGGGRDG